MERLYKQEILELTSLLRNDEEWEDLRNVLTKTGFNIKEIVLASFVEDDEENEYGVIITSDLKIMEYSRSTQNGKNNVNYFELNDITNKEHKIKEYPQISVAVNMIKRKLNYEKN